MKWIIIFSLCSLQACSQPTSNNKPQKFNSKYVRLIEDTSKMMLIENVIIHYDDLYVEADSALLDKPNYTVTAFGIKKARFKGIEIKKQEYRGLIRYRKGDAKFYSE
jgi:lipopolysaccharide export system protein LptA